MDFNYDLINFKSYGSLFSCFDDMYSCLLGLFCPSCLFGDTYEKAGFGNCLSGFFKMFSLQVTVSSIFLLVYLNIYYHLMYLNITPYLDDIAHCEKNTTCSFDIEYLNSNYYNSECSFLNNSISCECLENSLTNYCNFNNNQLPGIVEKLSIYTSLINLGHFLTISFIFGIFSGYYRRKISHKLSISENSQKSFWIHCCFFTHLLALCQEYKAVKNKLPKNDLVTPIQPIQIKHIEEKHIEKNKEKKPKLNTNFMA